MKISIKWALLCAIAFVLAACTTPGASSSSGVASVQPTPAQIALQVCPPVQTAMTGLNSLVGLPPGAQKDLAAITPLVTDVCAVGATVNTNNLEQLAQTALPGIVSVVKSSPLSAEEQNAIIVDVTAAQLILTAVAQARTNLNASTPAAQQAGASTTK